MARKKQTEDQPEENNDPNSGSDDTFGLPEIEYQPINRENPPVENVRPPQPEPEPEPEARKQIDPPVHTEDQPVTNTPMEREEVRQTEYTSTYYDEDESNSPWPKILGIALLILIIAGAGWYFGYKKPNDEAAAREKAQQEEQSRLEASRAQEARLAEQNRIAAENQRLADSVANATPPLGSVETLNGRTGRYYVVIASSIDGDLIMDLAKELSGKGVNAKIIPPYGRVKFHRLSVAEGETFVSTQEMAEQLKSQYTEAAWVLKY